MESPPRNKEGEQLFTKQQWDDFAAMDRYLAEQAKVSNDSWRKRQAAGRNVATGVGIFLIGFVLGSF